MGLHPAPESPLGPVVREHKVTTSGLLGWLAAAALGALACPFFLHFAFTAHEFSLKSAVGGVTMGVMSLWALKEWNRLRRLSLALHEQGLSLRVGGSVSSVPWTEVLALEARYVPGLRKRGTANEGNCVSLLVLTARCGWLTLPKELESFHALRSTIAQRSGHHEQQVLIQNLTQR